VKLWVLGSGSRGNALLLEVGQDRVLIDAGFPARHLAHRIALTGVAPESISAVVVTHEHQDHVRGIPSSVRRWKWTVHATPGTIANCPALAAAGARVWSRDEKLRIGDLELDAIPVSHDAGEPIALVATSRGDGARMGIAHDVGRVSQGLRSAFLSLDVLVLESNHDREMLRRGPYPAVVQERISGGRGHLPNESAAELAGECVHAGLRQVVLAHMSEQCNAPELALGSMRHVLARTRFRGRVQLTSQDQVTGPVEASGRAVQLGLGI
jgi:phosphoribosyl 1,2-cyclic phosphodiesterase